MDTIDVIERISSLVEGEKRRALGEYGLLPVHLDILLYLKQCNRYSDTPLAISEYLNLTKGTVSQSVKNLEKKGLLEKAADQKDKRVVHLCLTKEGIDVAEHTWPPESIAAALAQLTGQKQDSLNKSLIELLRNAQQANEKKAFGQCLQCVYNQPQTDGSILCGLTGDALSTQDIKLICREFSVDNKMT